MHRLVKEPLVINPTLDDLDSLQTRLIKVFPRIEEVRVQWIVGDRQGALELENQDGLIRGWR